MLTQEKELTQGQIADARKLCQIKQGIRPEQWPLLRMILTAYIDGIGTGLQFSGQEDGQYEQASHGAKTVLIRR